MDIELVKKAQKAFEWYDKAVDNSIDYLNLEREEQQDAWNALDKLFEAIARQSATTEDVQMAIGDLLDMKEHWCADSTDNDAISIDLAITALQAYRKPSAIKWTGDNLREVISMTGWNESASSKWTWEEYEQVVKEKGLKIFTPDGSVIADIGSWIIRDGNDCFVLQAYQPWIPVSERLPTEEDADGNANVMCLFADNAIETWAWNEITEWNLDDTRKEQVFAGITHWRPMLPEPPKGE